MSKQDTEIDYSDWMVKDFNNYKTLQRKRGNLWCKYGERNITSLSHNLLTRLPVVSGSNEWNCDFCLRAQHNDNNKPTKDKSMRIIVLSVFHSWHISRCKLCARVCVCLIFDLCAALFGSVALDFLFPNAGLIRCWQSVPNTKTTLMEMVYWRHVSRLRPIVFNPPLSSSQS